MRVNRLGQAGSGWNVEKVIGFLIYFESKASNKRTSRFLHHPIIPLASICTHIFCFPSENIHVCTRSHTPCLLKHVTLPFLPYITYISFSHSMKTNANVVLSLFPLLDISLILCPLYSKNLFFLSLFGSSFLIFFKPIPIRLWSPNTAPKLLSPKSPITFILLI